MSLPPTLCLMLKAPRVGKVKTRLAASLGEQAALEVYQRLVEFQAAQIPCDWPVEVHFTPADAGGEMKQWLAPLLPRQTQFHAQVEGDLGARLGGALEGACKRGATHTLFIGGDCPQLTTEWLLLAASHLGEASFVVIPALDGGYVLIGLTGPHHFVFEQISWSSAAVLSQTLAKIEASEMPVEVLPPLEDVDDVASLNRVWSSLP